MHCHANALLTPKGQVSVFELVEAGMTVQAARNAAHEAVRRLLIDRQTD